MTFPRKVTAKRDDRTCFVSTVLACLGVWEYPCRLLRDHSQKLLSNITKSPVSPIYCLIAVPERRRFLYSSSVFGRVYPRVGIDDNAQAFYRRTHLRSSIRYDIYNTTGQHVNFYVGANDTTVWYTPHSHQCREKRRSIKRDKCSVLPNNSDAKFLSACGIIIAKLTSSSSFYTYNCKFAFDLCVRLR